MEIRYELHVVREVVEGALAPDLAAAVIFRALCSVDELPRDTESVWALCRGPLADALTARLGAEVTEQVLERIEQVLMRGSGTASEAQRKIEADLALDRTTKMPVVFSVPVNVLVVSSKFRFAERLVASLGDERVYVTCVMGERELRRSMATFKPLVVVVDATAAPFVPADVVAQCMSELPDYALRVVWGDHMAYGQRLLVSLSTTDGIGIDEADGIEPLLDLVLARYGGDQRS